MSKRALMILVAGPYRSGTNDEPEKLQANANAMYAAAVQLFRKGHIPVTGEALALSMIELAGSTQVGDAVFNELFHPMAERILPRCDAVLRIGGPSVGADEMVSQALRHGKMVFTALEQVPLAS